MQWFKYLQLEINCLNRAEAGNKSRLENIGPVETGTENLFLLVPVKSISEFICQVPG